MTAARFAGTIFWRDARLAMTSRVPFLFDVLGVLAALTIYLFVGRFAGRAVDPTGVGFLSFVAAGVAAMQMQAAVLRAVHGLDREQASGGMEMLLIGPVRAPVVALAVMAFPLARGVAFALLALLISGVVFGAELRFGPGAWPGVVCGLAALAAGFAVVAMLCFSVLVAIRQGPAAASLFGIVIPVLSGVYFPTSLLPQPVEAIASASPLTLAVDTLRAAVIQGEFSAGRVLATVALLALLLALAWAIVDAVVLRAKRRGTLGHS